MKKYTKPETEVIDASTFNPFAGTEGHNSVGYDRSDTKGTNEWVEEEENDDSGFDW